MLPIHNFLNMISNLQTICHILISIFWLQITLAVDDPRPTDFPSTIPIKVETFINWSKETIVPNVWIATPSNEDDIVSLIYWALGQNFTLRAKGFSHNWSPITITEDTNPDRVILVDTTTNFKNIQPPIFISSTKFAVTAQTGASMLAFLSFLEDNGLGLYGGVPSAGDLTIGGVLAIAGRGTGVPAIGETIPDGHAFGTFSNLVISFRAVVWNALANKYILKTFQRSDVDAAALLVCFGRIFIVEVTLMVGLNYNLRCQSDTSITTDELFSLVPGRNALINFVNKSGRVQIFRFPFTNKPWLKVCTIEPKNFLLSREVHKPFNYPFYDNIPVEVSDIVGEMIKGAWHLSPLLGATQLAVIAIGLKATLSFDLWGPSKNHLLYVKPTTLRVTVFGFAVSTSRSNVQKVVSRFSEFYDSLVAYYQIQGKYPFNGPYEIRLTSIDKNNIVSANSVAPTLSPIHPWNDHPEYDIVVWYDVANIPNTPYLSEALAKLEAFLIDEYDGTYASVRPEWSKGWAYTDQSGWSNSTFIRQFIPSTFPGTTDSDGWNWAVQTLDKYDPDRIFTNPLLTSLLQTTSS